MSRATETKYDYPKLGEIRLAKEIGIKAGERNRQKFIWTRCPDCGVERWVCVLYGKPKYEKCHKCATKYDHKSPRGVLAKGTIGNPIEGDIRFGDELAHKTGNKYIWRLCLGCGSGKWVQLKGKRPNNQRCCKCLQLNISDTKRKTRLIPRGLFAKGTVNNPIVGDVRFGDEIGKYQGHRFMWRECERCHKPIGWVAIRPDHKLTSLCPHCHSGTRSHKWRGNAYTTVWGYRLVYINSESPYYSMATYKNIADGGYVFEHRLVMAQHLGRVLHKWEVVHHKNHIRTDNRIENLELLKVEHHEGLTILENKITNLSRKVMALEDKLASQNQTIHLLMWHISENNKSEVNNVTPN